MFCEIQNVDSETIAHAPRDTRPNDWIVWMVTNPVSMYTKHGRKARHKDTDGTLAQDTVGLILRSSFNGRYEIVGPTYPVQGFSSRPHLKRDVKCFVVWWTPEDLLVLEWRISHYDVFRKPTEQTNMYSTLRICRSRNRLSSYAMGPCDAKEIEAKMKSSGLRAFVERHAQHDNGAFAIATNEYARSLELSRAFRDKK